MRTMQPQLSAFHFRPNAPLHLHYSIEAGLAALLQGRHCFRQGLARIEVKNRNPLWAGAALLSRPLFNGKEAMWHRVGIYLVRQGATLRRFRSKAREFQSKHFKRASAS